MGGATAVSRAICVNGTLSSGAVMPGWRFTGNRLTVSVFAGPVVQDYRLSP
jgi:hypothetical protein